MKNNHVQLYDVLSYLAICYEVDLEGEYVNLKRLSNQIESLGKKEKIDDFIHLSMSLMEERVGK